MIWGFYENCNSVDCTEISIFLHLHVSVIGGLSPVSTSHWMQQVDTGKNLPAVTEFGSHREKCH
jgi:hypothetical protein